MARYDHIVLNALLDSYENSLLSIGENKRTVHIDYNFTKRNIPQYYDESSQEYEAIHILMKSLEDKGLVEILWKNDIKDHQIEKIRMRTERLNEIYAAVGRMPKSELEQDTIRLLDGYLELLSDEVKEGEVTEKVVYRFGRYLLSRLSSHQSVKEYIDLNKAEDIIRLLHTIYCVEQNVEERYIREFSVTHFRDSKYFEGVEHKITGIFRRFGEGFDDMEDDEILAEYHIYHTPNYVYIKGNAGLSIGREVIRLDSLNQGIGLSGEDIENVRFTDLSMVKKVLTIENLTTFFSWHESDCLIIYLGGYHNGVRRRLLNEIYKSLPDAEYYHFGDIDAGGFSILKDLRNKTGIPFHEYNMDLDTLIGYEEYGRKLTGNDRKRLEELARQYPQWEETIRYMLEHNVKIEQECIGASVVLDSAEQ
ncbi:MAG: DUF2220 domain-containing protein [Lachnospiraceae bacterium]|nr:DUF2220 domain-containing protein [Lachnospiraceae bacterium]